MPKFTVNHGRRILRELWWEKHERLFSIVMWGVTALAIVLFWSYQLDYLVTNYKPH
jgi:hypothetical protein